MKTETIVKTVNTLGIKTESELETTFLIDQLMGRKKAEVCREILTQGIDSSYTTMVQAVLQKLWDNEQIAKEYLLSLNANWQQTCKRAAKANGIDLDNALKIGVKLQGDSVVIFLVTNTKDKIKKSPDFSKALEIAHEHSLKADKELKEAMLAAFKEAIGYGL